MQKLLKYIGILILLITIQFNGYSQAKGLESLSIVISYKSTPTGVSIIHTPLRYNKDFALSFTLDDGNKDAYSHAYKFLIGETVEGVDYNPLYYTDGCGNDINFTMSAAVFSLSTDEVYDYRDPDLASVSDIYISWPDIIELYQNGWGILNHGLTASSSIDMDYSVARNHSYIKRNTIDSIEGGIQPTVFVNPNGTAEFNEPAFNQDYHATLRSISYGIDYLNVYNTGTIVDLEELKMGRHLLTPSVSLATLADDLNSASADPLISPWASTFSHSITGKYGSYSFGTFKTYIEYIATTYGKDGTDNVWFTSEEEVMDYLLVKDNISIDQTIDGNNITLNFTGANIPDNLRTYALSLALSSSANDTITGININGHSTATFTGINDDVALINLSWDGFNAPENLEMANFYVDSAELIRTQNVANIAMDYVAMLEYGWEKQVLKDRLCAISEVSLPAEFCTTCSTDIGNDTTICLDDCITLSVNDETSYLWSNGETDSNISVCPTSSTEYSVKVFDELGCESRDTIMINVVPRPIVKTSNDTTICPGKTVTIWANGGSDYLWSTGESADTIQVNPTVNTKYYVSVFNSSGCETRDSVSVEMYPVPNTESSPNQNIVPGEKAIIFASGGDNYLWNTGETTSQIEVSPTEPCWYSVEVFNQWGCCVRDSVFVTQRIPHEKGAALVGVQSVVVIFDQSPGFVNVNSTPLKYDKDFALSLHIKNGNKDIYTHAFPFLNGGSIEGVTYPGLTFTDGCDNDVNFKMGTSIYSFANDGTTDVHDPDGAFTEDFATWDEIAELYNAGWGVFNQGVIANNSLDKDYTIARNHSYTKYQTHESIEGGIPMVTFMNPSGDTTFSANAFDLDYRAAFADYSYGVQYYNAKLIPDTDSLKMGINPLDNQQSLASLADLVHNNFIDTTRLWASANISTITDGNTLGYSFSVFRFYLNYINEKYGKNGLDNIWFTHEEEVWDYLTVYESTSIHTEQLDDRLLITFSGNLPTNMNNYALTLLIESDANISSIEINGGEASTYKIKSDTSALLNLNWDSRVIIADSVLAENHVAVAETSRSQEDAFIAMDYVNMLEVSPKKDELRSRLCAITEANLPIDYCNCSFSLPADTLICMDDCIDLTAPEGVSYIWSTGELSQSIEVCPPDTSSYWVTVFNEYDCYFTDTIAVNVNRDDFAFAGLDTTICELETVELIASGGVSYLWSTGDVNDTIAVSPDINTDYYVTVTNAIGCVSRDTVNVSLYALPSPEIIADQNICEKDSVELWVSGGSSYFWTNTSETTDTIKVSPADTTKYYVWVYNENDCQVLDSVTVNVIPLPNADAGLDTEVCFGDCVSLTASGGTEYEWSTNETTASIEVCPDDTSMYYVDVYNDFGCVSNDSVQVMVKDVPVSETINDTIVCPNECIKIWASGGVDYLWSTGETNDTIEVCPSEETKYYVEVFNNLGCSTLDSVIVDTYLATNANAGEDVTICHDGCADLRATGGYSYLWNTGQTTNSIEVCPDTDTEYYVTVYNEFNCPANDTVMVFRKPKPDIDAGNDTIKCFSDCIDIKATGGISYQWIHGPTSRITQVCPTTATTYYVRGIDEHGCYALDSVSVFINDYTEANLSGLLPVYCENASSVLLEGSPANGAFGGNGVSGNVFSPAQAGVGDHKIYYEITDNVGCTITDSVDVRVNAIPEFTLGNDTTLCTDETMEIFLPNNFDQYLWSNGQLVGWYFLVEVAKFELGENELEVIVTDNGCVARDTILITYESCGVGIDELQEIGVKVYPNPSAGSINISYDGRLSDQHFSIMNLQGQVVYTKKLEGCSSEECYETLDLNYLNKGTYIIRFYNKNMSRSGKLIIQ